MHSARVCVWQPLYSLFCLIRVAESEAMRRAHVDRASEKAPNVEFMAGEDGNPKYDGPRLAQNRVEIVIMNSGSGQLRVCWY